MLTKNTDILKTIGNDWQQVHTEDERIKSDVRVYCDNGKASNVVALDLCTYSTTSDARFKAVAKETWYDEVDRMVAKGQQPPCQQLDGTHAITYNYRSKNQRPTVDNPNPPQHNEKRSTITVGHLTISNIFE